MRKTILVLFLLSVLVPPVLGAPSLEQEQAVLTNEDVVKMVEAGLGDDVIIAMLDGAKTGFETSLDAILALKERGVSEKVIEAMVKASTAVKAATEAAVEAASLKEAGIYFEIGESEELIKLEPAVFSSRKSGGVLSAFTALAPRKNKASLRSAEARLRVETASPVFYFYFESTGAGLSNTGASGVGVAGPAGLIGIGVFSGFMQGASSPNEFVLVKLDKKKDERELNLGRQWVFGDKAGVRSDDTIEIVFENLEPGVYRVTLGEPLKKGEYAFFYAAGADALQGGSGKVFDFGVDLR